MSYSDALDRMMDNLRVRLPGALDTAIKDELFVVVDEFFKTTKAWQEMQTFTTQAGVQNYDVVPDEAAIIDDLLGVYSATNGLPNGVTTNSDNWQVTVARFGRRVDAAMPVPGTVLLLNAQSQIATLAAIISLTVNAPKTDDGFPIVPTWLCDRYAASAWFEGVLGRMYSQPAKPYTNQNMAVYHLRRFRNAMSVAAAQARRQNKYGGQAWVFPQGWGSRHPRG